MCEYFNEISNSCVHFLVLNLSLTSYNSLFRKGVCDFKYDIVGNSTN